jgi:hypothetical protein
VVSREEVHAGEVFSFELDKDVINVGDRVRILLSDFIKLPVVHTEPWGKWILWVTSFLWYHHYWGCPWRVGPADNSSFFHLFDFPSHPFAILDGSFIWPVLDWLASLSVDLMGESNAGLLDLLKFCGHHIFMFFYQVMDAFGLLFGELLSNLVYEFACPFGLFFLIHC